MPSISTLHGLGYWLVQKYRTAARERGYFAVAAQLRKQGVPLDVARFILIEGRVE